MKFRGQRPPRSRRYAVLLIVLPCVGAVGWVASSPANDDGAAVFSVAPEVWIPQVPQPEALESTWFCPGVPVSGETDSGGAVIVTNTSAEPTQAIVTVMSDSAPSKSTVVDVAAYDRVQVDIDAEIDGRYGAATVEILGGGGLVEQRAFYSAGETLGQSSTPCATTLSAEWYLPEGYTVDEATDLIILSNPSDDQIVVDVLFHTSNGVQRPAAFTGLPVSARSLRIVDVGIEGGGARGDASVGVSVHAAQGALMVGRVMAADDTRRGGSSISMGAPLVSDRWWFVDGEKGTQVAERFSVMNPTELTVTVTATFFPAGNTTAPVATSLSIDPNDVAVLDAGEFADLPEGTHSVLFSTLDGRSIVVDRALTRVGADGGKVTSIAFGVPERRDGHVPQTWFLAAGPSVPMDTGLVLLNLDNLAGEVTVYSLGSNGPVVVPGLQQIPLEAASTLAIPLTDQAVLGRPLVIESTSRVLVERRLPSGDGVSQSWALAGEACC